jgi:hypothetical protein
MQTYGNRWHGERICSLAAVALLIVVQQTANLDGLGLFGRTLSNMMHLPLFLCITLLLARALPSLNLLAIGGMAISIGLVTEAIQLFNDRHASLFDVALNTTGTALALAGLAVARSWGPAATLGRYLVLWSSTGALAIALTLTAPIRILLAYDHRDRTFPVIWEASAWPGALLLDANGSFRLRPAPADWSERSGQRVLEVTWADVPYPRFQVLEVVPDWVGFDTVVIEAYLPEGPPISLTAALGRRGQMVARGVSSARIQPGAQTLIFDLPELAMDVSGAPIERFVLRAPNSAAGQTLLIGSIELRRSDQARAAEAGSRSD